MRGRELRLVVVPPAEDVADRPQEVAVRLVRVMVCGWKGEG